MNDINMLLFVSPTRESGPGLTRVSNVRTRMVLRVLKLFIFKHLPCKYPMKSTD